MKRSKVTAEILCRAFNETRQSYVGRKLKREQIIQLLQKEGVTKWLTLRMLQIPNLFTKVKREDGRGNCVGYIFPYTPVHISWFQSWLKNQHVRKDEKKEEKKLSFEEECVQYLKENGYALRKCIGFDEASFSKDHPDLYQQYLRYEEK